jgi:hypothetical protein
VQVVAGGWRASDEQTALSFVSQCLLDSDWVKKKAIILVSETDLFQYRIDEVVGFASTRPRAHVLSEHHRWHEPSASTIE